MVIVGHHVVDLHAEGAAAELHRLGEEAKDRVHAAVVTRELVAARHIPDGVLIHRLPEGVDVALGEVGPLIRLVAGSAGEDIPDRESTQLLDWGVPCRRQRLALALVFRALALADRAGEALATIDNCSTALRSVRTDLTDRDKLRPWAPGNPHQIVGAAVTTPSRSRPASISTRKMTRG